MNESYNLNLNDKAYILGPHANRPELPDLTWNPDAQSSINPHKLICGGSGAGKTTLLKSIARYLTYRQKHVFIFDLKGDMLIEDGSGNLMGNYIEFTAWKSQYGINPFEFDTGITNDDLSELINSKLDPTPEQLFKIRNSGPKVQVDRIIEIIQKNFMPTMGAFQKNVLMYLLSDTYQKNGIIYDDYSTWLNPLPSLADFLELVYEIKSEMSEGYTSPMIDLRTHEFLAQIQEKIVSLQDASDEDDNPDLTPSALLSSIQKSLDDYVDYGKKTLTADNVTQMPRPLEEQGIDISKYYSKKVMTTMETVESYIKALHTSGVFHSEKPPVKAGLNIINISGLDVSIQRFLVDIFIGKLFRSCKIRGNYCDLPNKSRGQKSDTFVIVDESKLIAGTSRDKNNPYSYLNRMATESRSFGLGLIVASQSAEHFPPEFLKNFDSQIILNTGIADFEAVRKSFGLDKAMLEFTQNGWGHALVKSGKVFTKIKLTSH